MRQLNLVFIAFIFYSGSLRAQSAKEVWDLYAKQDLEQVIAVGTAALKTKPDDVQLNLAVGRALADREQYRDAIPFLEKATQANSAELAPVKGWALAYLGRCCYATDQYDKAKKSFRACVALNATKNATQYAAKRITYLQLSSYYDSWEIMETEHFRFHFQNKGKISNVASFIVNRENAFEKINEFFQAKLYKKIDFYVWEREENALQVLGKKLGFADSDPGFINSLASQTLGHEIAHILSDWGMKPKSKVRLINEGVAVFFDQRNNDRLAAASGPYKKSAIRILDLWNNPDRYPEEIYYSVGGALIEFLYHHGTADQLKGVLKNQTVENAKTIYPNFEALMEQFENALLNK